MATPSILRALRATESFCLRQWPPPASTYLSSHNPFPKRCSPHPPHLTSLRRHARSLSTTLTPLSATAPPRTPARPPGPGAGTAPRARRARRVERARGRAGEDGGLLAVCGRHVDQRRAHAPAAGCHDVEVDGAGGVPVWERGAQGLFGGRGQGGEIGFYGGKL